MRIQQSVAVPLRDHTVLRADVYLPDTGARVPAIVIRTPYDRAGHRDREIVRLATDADTPMESKDRARLREHLEARQACPSPSWPS